MSATVDFEKVVDDLVRRMGKDPAAALPAALVGLYAQVLSEACREGWEHTFWPQVMVIEQRQFRPTWTEGVGVVGAQDVSLDDLTPTEGVAAYEVALGDNAPVTLTAPNGDTDYVFVTVNSGGIRLTLDGTLPTTERGTELTAGGTLLLSAASAAAFRAVRLWDAAAELAVTEFSATGAVSYTAAGTEVYWPQVGAYYQALRRTPDTEPPTDADGVVNDAYWAECASYYTEASAWQAALAYAVGDDVFYGPTQTFYRLHTTAAAGTLPTNLNYWGALTVWLPVLPVTQDWHEQEIGAVEIERALFGDDPRLWAAELQGLSGVRMLSDGLYCADSQCPAKPYVRFRPPAPTFNASDTDWEEAEFPGWLRRYAVLRAAGDLLTEDQARYRSAAAADDELERLEGVYLIDSGESGRAIR